MKISFNYKIKIGINTDLVIKPTASLHSTVFIVFVNYPFSFCFNFYDYGGLIKVKVEILCIETINKNYYYFSLLLMIFTISK